MPKIVNIIGKRFNRLVVIKHKYKFGRGKVKRISAWECICDCGTMTVVSSANLNNNNVKSCGCLVMEKNKESSRTHGRSYSKFYKVWQGIRQRCGNKKDAAYKYYGGRGITYDPRWEEFDGFRRDMYFKYLYALKQLKMRKPSIERKNVNGNYCNDNCTWIPMNEQGKNKRNSRQNNNLISEANNIIKI